MTGWRRPQFTALALLALLALLMPSLAWTCPVTGRAGAAATICNHPTDGGSSAAVMPCCANMRDGKCCKPLPQLPNNDSSRDTALAPTHVDASAILSHLSQAACTGFVVFVLPPAPLVIAPAGITSDDPVFDAPLSSQHAPPAASGRAPPRFS